jgi:hypothetical protein
MISSTIEDLIFIPFLVKTRDNNKEHKKHETLIPEQ